MTTPAPLLGDTAVVIGGSIAGLATARVLADHYASVVVVERDPLPDGPQHRQGTPQSRHVHALLPGGRLALEDLVPGFSDAIVRAGGVLSDFGGEFARYGRSGAMARRPSAMRTALASRPLIEHTLRALVTTRPEVTVVDHTDVLGLIWTGGRVAGVRTIGRAPSSAEVDIRADLVVDASGRGTRVPHWLAEHGLPAPAVEELRIDLAYVTGGYRLPEDARDWLGVLMMPTRTAPAGAACIRREDGSFHLTIARYGASTRDADVRAWAHALGDPALVQVLETAVPIEPECTFRTVADVRRRYAKTPTPPGLLAVGDAIAHFNPAYGQGMTVAALEAVALRDLLRRHGDHRIAERFYPAADRIIDQAWRIVTTGDRMCPWVDGHDRRDVRLMNRWLDLVNEAATVDPAVTETFAAVSGFVAPASALFRPGFVVRVLRAARRARPAVPIEPGRRAAGSSSRRAA